MANAINKTISSTPSALAVPTWDANSNMSANNLLGGFLTTARVNSSTYTLTVASALTQEWTGTSNFGDNVLMPVCSTLVTGTTYTLINSSDQPLTIQTSSGAALISLPAGVAVVMICRLASGTTSASWYWNANSIATLPGITIGSWTPTLTAATPGTISVAYSTQTGTYMRWTTSSGSSFVNIYCSLTCTATNGTASGDMRITGLPFTANGNGASSTASASSASWAWGAGLTDIAFYISQSPIAVRIFKMGTANNGSSMQITDITSATSNIYRFQMTYQI